LYKLKILREADKELQEGAQWYEGQADGLGLRFIEVIKHKLEVIQKYPERNPKRKGNFRETIVRTFPYIIIYTFYKREMIITINSIFHTSRNPKKKYRKKR
jgi:hypothetical protein